MSDSNLKIIAYDNPQGGKRKSEIAEFVVDFNPNTFTIANKIEYQKAEVKGQTGGDPQFDKIPPLEFSIEFVIDGTGVAVSNSTSSGKKDYVQQRIKKLREVTGSAINGDIHRPNYLALLWGSIYIECVVTALNITYNLFDREGTPLRAKVNCSFLERIGPGKGGRQSRLESADLTTYFIVREGDQLPLIANEKYGDAGFYIRLAKANKLKNFRDLKAGTRLTLAPVKEKEDE